MGKPIDWRGVRAVVDAESAQIAALRKEVAALAKRLARVERERERLRRAVLDLSERSSYVRRPKPITDTIAWARATDPKLATRLRALPDEDNATPAPDATEARGDG